MFFISFLYFSGLEGSAEDSSSSWRGSVRPVYLRCSQGSVSWLYPRGALRVVLRLGTAGKEFQVTTSRPPHSLFIQITYIRAKADERRRRRKEFSLSQQHLPGRKTIKKSNFPLFPFDLPFQHTRFFLSFSLIKVVRGDSRKRIRK